MDILRAIVLGLIQALTEFLPISSSAHLIIFREWLGFENVDGLTFDVAVHVGTLLALIVYFRRDLTHLLTALVSSIARRTISEDPYQRIAWLIALATVPAAVAGALLESAIESVLRSPVVVVITLVAVSIIFLVVERVCRADREMTAITLRTALLVGFAQALALIPGVSRSGITTVAGMTQGLQRAEAARFSFLLGIPIMVGAAGVKLIAFDSLSLSTDQVGAIVAGILSAAVGGWLVIRFLLRFFQRHRLDAFAWYRIVLAIVVLVTLVI